MNRVRAIVVGVEQYAAGWELDGPASDACRFVEILLGRGVPRDCITMLANPLPANVSKVRRSGIGFAEPDRETVTRVLRAELAADPADRLYFFWGGHGVVDDDDNHRLFYADATTADKHNLDFSDFVASLRTMAYPALSHQFLVVDACQNYAAQLKYAATLPQDRMPKAARVAGREQHILFAASPGQRALNDSPNKTGAFSREVLKILADEKTAWPPQADVLAAHLRLVFDRMRVDDPSAQTPRYLWHKTPRSEGVDPGDAASAPAPEQIPLLNGTASASLVRSVTGMPSIASGFQDRPQFSQLRRVLAAPSRIAVVAGGLGVGKTQLAAAYCRLCDAERWPVIVWIPAESEASIVAGLTRFADRIGLPDVDSEPEEAADPAKAAAASIQWLTEHAGPSLVIFDNADDPDVVARWMPKIGPARVVITTTDQRFIRLGTPVSVDVYSIDQAVAYLKEQASAPDTAGAADVAAEVGYLPLALAQAAALIGGPQFPTYQAYLTALANTDVRILLDHVVGHPYPRGFPAAIMLAVDAVTTGPHGPMLRRLLEVLALLVPDGVPIEYLTALIPTSDAQAPSVGALVQVLVDRSLVSWSAVREEVVMHRLIGRTLRDLHRSAGSLDDLIDTTADLLKAAVPAAAEHQLASRDVWRRLGPQTTALRAHTPETSRSGIAIKVMRLGWDYLRHLVKVADYRQAIEVGTVVYADARRLLGGDDPDTLSIRNNLLGVYQLAGRVTEAIILHEQNLADRIRVLGDSHPDTMNTRNNLAHAYVLAGRVAEGITLHEQNLADRIRILGDDHPDTMQTRHNLAVAYLSKGGLDEAIPLLEQTLIDRIRVLGTDHADTLSTRMNLAGAYHEAGRAEAIPLLEDVLADLVRLFGGEDRSTLIASENLAEAYLDAGRVAEGISLHEQNLADCIRILGDDDPDTLATRISVANAYRTAGRLTEAIALHEQNLTDSIRVRGGDDPETLEARATLANTYLAAGRRTEAIALHEQNLADRIRILGEEHPATMQTRNDIARAS